MLPIYDWIACMLNESRIWSPVFVFPTHCRQCYDLEIAIDVYSLHIDNVT